MSFLYFIGGVVAVVVALIAGRLCLLMHEDLDALCVIFVCGVILGLIIGLIISQLF